jgi:hypothetical protein
MWGDAWNPQFWGIRNGFTPGHNNIIPFFVFLLFLAKNQNK